MAKFRDLTPKSISTLEPYVTFWELTEKLDLDRSIDHKFKIETTGKRYLAEYAISYAVLLDDKELAEDLCKNGAKLDVVDGWTRKTPLEVAIDYGRAGVASILMKYGATLPKEVKIPSSNPCSHPVTYFWTLKEQACNREADYSAVYNVVHKPHRS